MYDYFLEYEKSNAANGGVSNDTVPGSTMLALTLADKWTSTALNDLEPPPVFPPDEAEEEPTGGTCGASIDGSRTPMTPAVE
jgi:hypothetical protein